MEPEETLFLRGRLRVYQYERGFRFGIDSVLLANFIELRFRDRALEIGAGCGLISFIAKVRFPYAKIYLLEKDPLYTKALKRGILANEFYQELFPIQGEALKLPFKGNYFDVVYLNPPYFKTASGRKSPYKLKELAKREEVFCLESALQEASHVLKNGGRFYIIFTAHRLAELIQLLLKAKLEPKVLRMVHSYPGGEAKRILIKAIKGAKSEIRILPPLYIYQKKGGNYSPEVKNFLEP
ncbi:MAG: methyltransferase [Caldimicrobium sp.]|nr:methyltransferase [Caldimicrobium sp.]MCX7873473.1 methyltransferase [Caldimicrobium sp.]MDW8094936.1 methyltransferase [Caldimicrobium sp.]